MDHTFRQLSELTGVRRDPVTLAEIPPASEPSPEQKSTETELMQTGNGLKMSPLPEEVGLKMSLMPEDVGLKMSPLHSGKGLKMGPLSSGKGLKMGPMPEDTSPETELIDLHDSVVDLAALRQNPLTVWRQIPRDLLDRFGQIITGEPFRVDWNMLWATLKWPISDNALVFPLRISP